METFVTGIVGGSFMIAVILYRANRILTQECRDFRKDARAAQAELEKVKNELEQQKMIQASPKVTALSNASAGAAKARLGQLQNEYKLLKSEHESAMDVLARIKSDVDKPENMSNTLAIKVRAYLTSVIGLAS